LETDQGSPLSQKFSSVPCGVFPMFHVFADIAEFAGGDALRSASSRSLAVDSLLLRKQGRIAALIANLTDVCQVVRLKNLKHSPTRARVLDESSADLAMRDPD